MTSRNEYTQMWSKREGAICNCERDREIRSFLCSLHIYIEIRSYAYTQFRPFVTSLFLSPSRNLLTRFSFVSLSTKCPNLSLISEFLFLSVFPPIFNYIYVLHHFTIFASFRFAFPLNICLRHFVFPTTLYPLVFTY